MAWLRRLAAASWASLITRSSSVSPGGGLRSSSSGSMSLGCLVGRGMGDGGREARERR